MKVIAFNGSARKDGNTALLIKKVFEGLESKNIETELIQMAGKPVHGCMACGKCRELKNGRCINDKDDINKYISKMAEADGIILGSPVYFANLTTEIKALIDRAGYVSMANGGLFRRKIGASVVAVRRAGAIHVFNSLNHFFFINQMIVPGSSYWNIGIGREPGTVAKDEEGLQTMLTLGENMAWLLSKVNSK
jgi:multimeric flavodoxin WrbA